MSHGYGSFRTMSDTATVCRTLIFAVGIVSGCSSSNEPASDPTPTSTAEPAFIVSTESIDEGWDGQLDVDGEAVAFDEDEAQEIVRSLRTARASRPGSPVEMAFSRTPTAPFTMEIDGVVSSPDERKTLEDTYETSIIARVRRRFQSRETQALERTARYLPSEALAVGGGTSGFPGSGDVAPSIPPVTGLERFVANDNLPLLELPDIEADPVTMLERGESVLVQSALPVISGGHAFVRVQRLSQAPYYIG